MELITDGAGKMSHRILSSRPWKAALPNSRVLTALWSKSWESIARNTTGTNASCTHVFAHGTAFRNENSANFSMGPVFERLKTSHVSSLWCIRRLCLLLENMIWSLERRKSLYVISRCDLVLLSSDNTTLPQATIGSLSKYHKFAESLLNLLVLSNEWSNLQALKPL
jgi:hypothetical protein